MIDKQKLGEVIRFGIVGVLATILQYAIYWLLIRWLNPSVAMTIGYLISFAFNFVASTRYTFRVKASAKRGAGFASRTLSTMCCRCSRSICSYGWACRSSGHLSRCSASACP